MADPTCLKNDAATPPDVAAILSAARPTPALSAELRTRVGRRIAALPPVPAHAGLSAPAGKLLLAGVVATLVAGSYLLLQRRAAQPLQPESPPAAPEPVDVSQPEVAPRVVEPAPSVLEVGPPPATPARVESRAAGPVRRPALRAADTLAQEAALLESARALLAESPARALATTRTHRRRYPNGQLAAERELIAIDALVRLGRASEAHRRGEAVGSLYRERVEGILAGTPEGGSGE